MNTIIEFNLSNACPS